MMYFLRSPLRRDNSALVLILAFLFVSCTEDQYSDDLNIYESCDYIISAENLGSVSAATIRTTANLAGYPQFAGYIDHSITVYKITYHTVFKGEPVIASGVISIPGGISKPLNIIFVGNGLILADRDAPSAFDLPDNYTGFEFIASVGYIAVIPDMLGFGASKHLIYPVHNYQHSARTMIDFIYACKEFLSYEKVKTSGRNFMLGYSQGGYIAMAALKMMQEENITDIGIEAAAVGAGGYNLVNLLKYAIARNTYPSPAHLAMVFTSYNQMYDWDRPVTDFFREPYAGRIPLIMNGSFDRQQADDQLTMNFDDLFNADFLQGLKDSSETAVYRALEENSVYDWTPDIPITMIHSLNDEKIPFSDSEAAYNKMVENGSASVQLVTTETEGHINAAMDFMEVVLGMFGEME